MNRTPKGFTLIELIAAMSLTALLSVALLGILSVIFRNAELSKEIIHEPAWERSLERLLDWEVQNSRLIQFSSDRLTFKGFARLDKNYDQGPFRETVSVYSIQGGGANYVLVRTQYNQDAIRTTSRIEEHVCYGIKRITWEQDQDQQERYYLFTAYNNEDEVIFSKRFVKERP